MTVIKPVVSLDGNLPVEAKLLSTIKLQDKEYEVFVLFRDDSGKIVDLPVEFEDGARAKTETAIQALMAAHEAQRAFSGGSPATIKNFIADGALYEGETTPRTHNFAIGALINTANTLLLSPYKTGSAQLIWDEVATHLTAKHAPKPKPLEERDLTTIDLKADDWGIEASIEQQIKILGNIANRRVTKVEEAVSAKLKEIYNKRTKRERKAQKNITTFEEWVALRWIHLMTSHFRNPIKKA